MDDELRKAAGTAVDVWDDTGTRHEDVVNAMNDLRKVLAKNANAAPEQEPVAWSHPDFDFAVMGKAPVNPPIEEWTPLVPLGSKSPSPQSAQPVARVTGYYAGRCVIEPLDGKSVFPTGMAMYSAPVAAQSAQPDLWDGAEEWERLAFELCADEHGEESCNELIWSDFEPWGERWMMYEDEAKRMIQLVRKHTAPPSREWQSLTDEEMRDVLRNCAASTFDKLAPHWYEVRQFARAIEQASRTKTQGKVMADSPADIQCPVCGYYCLGKGGIGCIDKPGLMFMTPRQKVAQDNFIDRFAARQEKEKESALRAKNTGER